MMDHTSLVRNVENKKTYAINPKELSDQNNGRKSLRTEILTLYGQDTADKIRQFERMRLQVMRRKSDLTFLKRCRDADVTPIFTIINHRLRNKKNDCIFHKANISLLRNEIQKARFKLDNLSRKLLVLHTTLANIIQPPLWARIDACSSLKTTKLEEIIVNKQRNKFTRLENTQKQVRMNRMHRLPPHPEQNTLYIHSTITSKLLLLA
jgi:hypothetical protein